MSFNPLVIFHSINGTMHCDDGFGAAWCAMLGISEGTPEFFPGIYGQPAPIEKMRDRTVYLLDFSYKRPVMDDIVFRGIPKRLVVLDHHKTAEAELAGFKEDCLRDYQIVAGGHGPQIDITFDMDRSGCMLAWRYFFGNFKEAPELLKRIEDGDLLRWDYPDSKFVQAALRSYPQDFGTWDRLVDMCIEDLAFEGEAIRRFIDHKVQEILPNAHRAELAGEGDVTMVNCPTFLASEVAGRLAEESREGWACAYADTATHRVYSLRSRGDVDVSEIAKRFGGGGHKNAAGFQEEIWT